MPDLCGEIPVTLAKAPDAPLTLVEWRVDGKPFDRDGKKLARFVPYLDAAAVATLLDEWVGPGAWRDAYEPTTLDGKAALWCHLSVLDDGVWVTKTDVGVASNFEAQKGMVSDAFKRAACLKWGAGRNVYDLPVVSAPCLVRSSQRGEQAYPSKDTHAYITRTLANLGYGDVGGRVNPETGEIEGESAVTAPVDQAGPSTVDGAADLPENLEALTYRELSMACAARDLKTSGKREALIARLRGEEAA